MSDSGPLEEIELASDSPEALIELFESRGWGDGLPLVPPTKDRDSAYYRRPDKYVDGENLVKVKISCGETAAGGLTGSRIRIFRAESASHQSKPQEIEVCEVGATGAAAVAGITVNGKRSVKTSASGKTSWESTADNIVAHLRDVGKIDAGRSDHG